MNTILLTTTITAIICGLSMSSYGQTFSEWFFQKKTRRRYMRQQLAALTMFREAVREGYNEAEEGIRQADDEEELTVEMDAAWLRSLGEVKDIFKGSNKVKSIYQLAQSFIRASDSRIILCKSSPWLIEPEKDQFEFDLNLVRTDMQQILKSLLNYITDGKVEMTDDERWRMIDELGRHVQLAGRFQLMQFMQMDAIIDTREQQQANDEFLKKHLP